MNVSQIHALAALLLSAASLGALAHGDEPHGDEPHPAGPAAPAGPRFEAATETFEMVGRLENGTLTLDINRFETNEPVLQATVELEAGERKAAAAYRADRGSYVVDDPRLVAALGRPGAHPVLVTVTAGDDADLLEATMTMAAPSAPPQPLPVEVPALAWAGSIGLVALGAAAWTVRRRRRLQGEPA